MPNSKAIPTRREPPGRRVEGDEKGHRGRLVEDVEEQAVLARIRDLGAGRASLADVARSLNFGGLEGCRGRWHPTSVSRVVKKLDDGPPGVELLFLPKDPTASHAALLEHLQGDPG